MTTNYSPLFTYGVKQMNSKAGTWVLTGAGMTAAWASVLVGLSVAAMSLPRGKRSRENYGSWDRYLV